MLMNVRLKEASGTRMEPFPQCQRAAIHITEAMDKRSTRMSRGFRIPTSATPGLYLRSPRKFLWLFVCPVERSPDAGLQ